MNARRVFGALLAHYGEPPAPPASDLFALVLYEQVAYLATDAKRIAAFRALRDQVGLTPTDILDASDDALRRVCALGGSIAVDDRAERMRESARLVVSQFGGDASAMLALPEDRARRALQQFPMIGEPAADKLLALAHKTARVPLDSNALRVLNRLALVPEQPNYSAMYRDAQRVLASLVPPSAPAGANVTLGAVLREHGLTLCKRSAPKCTGCPVRNECPSAEPLV